MNSDGNIDHATVEGFGDEWATFDQSGLKGDQYDRWFESYFGLFPFAELPAKAEGFDLGCGSGRWALGVAPKVGLLHCVDPAERALATARGRLASVDNVRFHLASADTLPFANSSQDFGYSLGVLHHVPDTAAALRAAVAKLKPGAPFLLYLYYAFDGRPEWYKRLWRLSEELRPTIAALPFKVRRRVTDAIALTVYWPLSRVAGVIEKVGGDPGLVPLSAYRGSSLHTLRTDALDRFGTKLEQRFDRSQISAMMKEAGLDQIKFSESEPFWVAVGRRR